VMRQALVVEFFEKVRLLAVGRLPEFGCFHGEITRGMSGTESSIGRVSVQDWGFARREWRSEANVSVLFTAD
jgi:hypothetical protein